MSSPTLLGEDTASCIGCGATITFPSHDSVPFDQLWRTRLSRCADCAPRFEVAYLAGEQVAAHRRAAMGRG